MTFEGRLYLITSVASYMQLIKLHPPARSTFLLKCHNTRIRTQPKTELETQYRPPVSYMSTLSIQALPPSVTWQTCAINMELISYYN